MIEAERPQSAPQAVAPSSPRAPTEQNMPLVVTDFSDYKEYLRQVIDLGARGIVRSLAEAAGCQRSYLSQALHSHINLTTEQLFGIAGYLGLSAPETEYLLLLLERDKAGRDAYRAHLESKLAKARHTSKRLAERLRATGADPRALLDAEKYYSSWHYAALHIATSLPHLHSAEDFASALHIPLAATRSALRELERWGLVAVVDGKWSYCDLGANNPLHLDARSPLSRMNNINWRSVALSRSGDETAEVHYSAVFTLSREDVGRLREIIIAFLADQRRRIATSGSEELCAFCCDFIKLT
jgi:transcriptional regulator with XRE-family HTH domain